MAKVLEFQLQHHSFQRNPRADLLQNRLVGSPCSPSDDNKCCDRSKTVAESDGVELLKVDEKNIFLEDVAFKLDLNDRKGPDIEDLSKKPGWQRDSSCKGIKAATTMM